MLLLLNHLRSDWPGNPLGHFRVGHTPFLTTLPSSRGHMSVAVFLAGPRPCPWHLLGIS